MNIQIFYVIYKEWSIRNLFAFQIVLHLSKNIHFISRDTLISIINAVFANYKNLTKAKLHCADHEFSHMKISIYLSQNEDTLSYDIYNFTLQTYKSSCDLKCVVK